MATNISKVSTAVEKNRAISGNNRQVQQLATVQELDLYVQYRMLPGIAVRRVKRRERGRRVRGAGLECRVHAREIYLYL